MANHRFTLDQNAMWALMSRLPVPIGLDVLGDDEVVQLYAEALHDQALYGHDDLGYSVNSALEGPCVYGIGEQLTDAEKALVREVLGVKIAA